MSRYEGLLAETMSFAGFNGDNLEGFLARPLGPGPYPGVVVCHRIKGWDFYPKEVAVRFASEGYLTICPNLFTREAPGLSPDDASMLVKQQGGLPDQQAVGDTVCAAKYLRSLPNCNGRIGIIGHGLGGRQAFLAACQEDFGAVVIAYGNSIATPFNEGRFCTVGPDVLAIKHPRLPLSLAQRIRTPMLGLFGANDPNNSRDVIEEIRKTLEDYSKEYEYHVYEDTGHEFMNPAETTYSVTAANDSWVKTLEFFQQHLSNAV